MQVVFLGATKPNRGILPTPLKKLGQTINVLNWQINSLKKSLKNFKLIFFGGYEINLIKKKFPQ